MKKGLVLVALAMLSWTAAGAAFAGPFGGRFARMPRQQPQQQPQRIQQDEGREFDGNADRERADKERLERERVERERAEKNPPQQPGPVAREEIRQGGSPGQGGQMPAGGRGARMSVEERQKLRHQINEAGHSLYTLPPASGNK